MEVALVGHPNVGKSVLFNRMTGVGAISSNYPGTTVEYLEGTVVHKGVTLHVYDLPGTYGLNGITEDEVVAVKLLAEHRPDVVVAVADATRLEPSLVMIYQLIELGFNVIVALNFMDVARRRHQIDFKLLQDILRVPVVPMVALTEEGVDVLVESIIENRAAVSDFKIKYAEDIEKVIDLMTPEASTVRSEYPVRGALLKLLEGNQYFTEHLPEGVKQMSMEERDRFKLKHDEDIDVHINRDRYGEAGLTIRRVQSRVERKLTRAERISEITLKPSTGIPILLTVLVGVFISIVIIGGLLESVLSQIYLDLTSGFFSWMATAIGGTFGQSISSGINLSIQAIISIVIPYILVFYLILALLEDSGYLPRVVILLDGVMHKFGLHGRAIIPMIVGTGCNVPAILATRVMESKRERLILATITILAVPCSAQTVVILGTIGKFGSIWYAALIYLILLAILLVLGRLLNHYMKFEPSGLMFEIPDMAMPHPRNVLFKTWLRVKDFFVVAFPILLVGSLVLEFLMNYGVLGSLVDPLSPFTVGFLGLPAVIIVALIFGVMRKEMSLQLLVILFGTANLASVMSPEQLFVFALIMATYVPCMSAMAVMVKEFGLKDSMKVTLASLAIAFSLGGLVHFLFTLH
ncbi:MAG: ferrous iron transport protein B [Methanomassiliicoccales archaeon]|jgi:ferrous iron transport protein B